MPKVFFNKVRPKLNSFVFENFNPLTFSLISFQNNYFSMGGGGGKNAFAPKMTVMATFWGGFIIPFLKDINERPDAIR